MPKSITVIHLPTALIDRSPRLANDLADFIEYSWQYASTNPSSSFSKRLAIAFPSACWTDPDASPQVSPEDLQAAAIGGAKEGVFLIRWATQSDVQCFTRCASESFWTCGPTFEKAAELAEEIESANRCAIPPSASQLSLLRTITAIFT